MYSLTAPRTKLVKYSRPTDQICSNKVTNTSVERDYRLQDADDAQTTCPGILGLPRDLGSRERHWSREPTIGACGDRCRAPSQQVPWVVSPGQPQSRLAEAGDQACTMPTKYARCHSLRYLLARQSPWRQAGGRMVFCAGRCCGFHPCPWSFLLSGSGWFCCKSSPSSFGFCLRSAIAASSRSSCHEPRWPFRRRPPSPRRFPKVSTMRWPFPMSTCCAPSGHHQPCPCRRAEDLPAR